MRSIEEIKAEFMLAMEEERERKAAAAKLVNPIYKFTLLPYTDKWYKVFDPSCKLYALEGEVTNKEELHAVGKTPFEGSMVYAFNSLSGYLVMAVGGGSSFTENPRCFVRLSHFIQDNPEGGDVSNFVNFYRGGK